MSKVIICRGIQGSGKSTWASDYVQQDLQHRIRVNWDDLRLMLGGGIKGYWVPERENIPYLNTLMYDAIDLAISRNHDVVIDNMNISQKTVMSIIDKVSKMAFKHNKKVTIDIVNFTTDVNTCIERDTKRPRPIGADIIRQTAARYEDFLGGYDPISIMFKQDGPIVVEPSGSEISQ